MFVLTGTAVRRLCDRQPVLSPGVRNAGWVAVSSQNYDEGLVLDADCRVWSSFVENRRICDMNKEVFCSQVN